MSWDAKCFFHGRRPIQWNIQVKKLYCLYRHLAVFINTKYMSEHISQTALEHAWQGKNNLYQTTYEWSHECHGTKYYNKHISAYHYNDVIMSTIASQITSLAIVYSTAYAGAYKKTSKLRVTGLCAGNSPGTGEFPAQRASNDENVSIWWRHHDPFCPGYI